MAFRNSILAGEELIRTGMRSANYVAGLAGWRVARNGDAEFNDLTVRGTFATGVGVPRIEIIPDAGPPGPAGIGPAVLFYPAAGGDPYVFAVDDNSDVLLLLTPNLLTGLSLHEEPGVPAGAELDLFTEGLLNLQALAVIIQAASSAELSALGGTLELKGSAGLALEVGFGALATLTVEGVAATPVRTRGVSGAADHAAPTFPAQYDMQGGRGATTVVGADYHEIALPTAFPNGLLSFTALVESTTEGYMVNPKLVAPLSSKSTLRFRVWRDDGVKRTTAINVVWTAFGY